MGSYLSTESRFSHPGKSVTLISILIIVVLLVLTISTGWFMNSSQKATETSVYNISEFYLRQLSAQTGRQIQNSLEYLSQNLKTAAQIIRTEDLEDQATLKQYLSNVVDLYDADFYALIDEDGTIYTKDGTLSGIPGLECQGAADFDKPYVSINQSLGVENMVLIVMPVHGLAFEGKALTGNLMGISAATISSQLSLKNEKDQIFSNVIFKDGSYIVKTPHNHIEDNDNVFSALENQVHFHDGYSVTQMREDIQAGKSGVVAYDLKGILHYTYYAPSEGTDWYLTTTIHYGTVSTNVESVRSTITKNSMIQLLLVMLVVFAVFMVYFWQRSRNEILTLEKIQAEESNKAKSRFLSNMSHDIRTPMNAIVGFTNLAMQHEFDPDTQHIHDYLLKIRTASNHLLSLINDVLDMSRIESGKIHLDVAPCSLSDLLASMNTIVHGQVQEKDQTLSIELSPQAYNYVCCDRLRLNQILLNLLGNAIKFTPEGGTISVAVSQTDQSRKGYGTYEFRVKDNGIGMSPEFAKKVYEPFEREHTSTVSGIQGTGLGMAITKNLIDLMGGTIQVETAPGQGTEFIIQVEFPLVEDRDRIKDMLQKEEDPNHFDFSGMRILLAEDNELNREIAVELLRDYGFEIHEVEDGALAVDAIANASPGQYHLILMDIQMPIMDGYTAAKTIRSLPNPLCHTIPIIAMTANAFEEDKKHAMECGMNGHISKPVDVDILIKTLADILSNSNHTS